MANALPTLRATSTEPDEQQQLLAALQRVDESLQARSEPNWFSVAGALLNPGRTGQFGEALGAAASELGQIGRAHV